MEFFKKLFGGSGSGSQTGDRNGMYFYIQPKGCDEVIRVRIDTMNDPSLNDDGNGYFVVKTVRGTTYKCTRSAELTLTFDGQKRLKSTDVRDGALVTHEQFEAWQASQS